MLRSIPLCMLVALAMLASCGSTEKKPEIYTQAQIDKIQRAVQTEGLCESVEEAKPTGWTADTVTIAVRCVNYGHSEDYSVTLGYNGSVAALKVQI